jgi:hypothetical protein
MKHKTQPSYLKWVFEDHYFKDGRGILKVIGTLFGIFMAFYIPGPVIKEYVEGWIPILPVIGTFIAVYGFLAGILLQPYLIYTRLVKLRWWDK